MTIATGIDKIPAKVLKVSADIIAPSLTAIFNLSLHTGKFVKIGESAKTTVRSLFCQSSAKYLRKKFFNNYITIGYLSENSLISKFQFGFRPKHSMLTLLIQMCHKWLENMDEGKITGLVPLDIRNAFDSINHQILLLKMKNLFGIQDSELICFVSYLSNHEQACYVDICPLAKN